jgi:hypothetical protein
VWGEDMEWECGMKVWVCLAVWSEGVGVRVDLRVREG